MACKLCGQNKPLVKAHIIPQSFWKDSGDGKWPPWKFSNTPGVQPSRSRTGEYDPDLVCADCEGRFGPWDDYAAKTLRVEVPEEAVLRVGQERLAWVVRDIEYDRLKLFFLAVLWRAGATDRQFFQRVKLGPHQGVLGGMLLNGDPGHPDVYSVVLTRFEDPIGRKAVMDPLLERLDGFRYCRIYLGLGYTAWIKVDQRATPREFAPLILRPDAPLTVLLRDLTKSKEWRAVMNIARANTDWRVS